MIEAERHNRRILALGLAMVASLWIHILGLALWQYLPPVPGDPPPPPLMLEIEMPLVEQLQPPKEAPKPEPPKEVPVAKETPPPEPVKPVLTDSPPVAHPQTLVAEEDTISLESKAPEYISYLGRIKVRIKNHWIFPPEAREKREFGRLSALFTLDRSGKLLQIIVEESSGNQLLDHAALEAVRGAAPFPSFPDHINLKRLNIRANFDYRIRFISVK